jgi:hypothetical protein
MTTIPLKNGWPWSSLIKMNLKPDEQLLIDITNKWYSINWGEDYGNNKMASNVTAINSDKRSVTWVVLANKHKEIIEDIALRVLNELAPHFPEKMQITSAGLSLLVPRGKLLWHHDGLSQYHYGTRVMLPLFNTDNINYHFTSWSDDTPTDAYFNAINYRDNDQVVESMTPGEYYIYNHRVPHKVDSFSDKPRGLFHIDIMPATIDFKSIVGKFEPISEFERTKIVKI